MKIRSELQIRKVGEDFIIVDPGQDMVDMSKVFTLNDTAAFVWNELKDIDFTEQTIIELLLANYDVDSETAAGDAKRLIDELRSGGLLIE
ncbi:PqqD family protein [Sphingobacterium lactis]|uniref:Coenzyme PQQ synthesis protein D (PqqD) n=1 Tax=Sphingobacterium lactis TaxID=797291 RepID=A0A1H6CK54_9SPHI|nr:PqqD family protein [Sphingobacterium lactis]SEG73308.1 Coenzyme PQQ synthesis protein D (PqqD) [Sphingobacterium lactis]